MATTFLGAMQEKYAQVLDTLTLWTCRIPEGTGFPQALLEHEGQGNVVYQSDGDGGAQETKYDDACRLTFWGENANELDLMAKRIMDAFTPNSLSIAGRGCILMRRSYRLTDDPARSQEGRIVFRAVIVYAAEID